LSLELFKLLRGVVTADSMFATNTVGSTVASVTTGTNVPLPNNQSLSSFTVNGANDTFTVPVSGRYLISYHINTTAAINVGTRLILNGGTAIAATILGASGNKNAFSNNSILSLTAGNTITLQLFDFNGNVTLLGGGATGASLAIVRIT
jgi:hypothetical protein